jgi:anti-sigma factor RsiW
VAPLAAAALVALVGVFVFHRPPWSESHDTVVNEALNDHLRELYAEHPIEVESGGIHQVKPWFSGRVDFAPVVSFSGDDDFPLLGGAVSYFVDRKAATFFFKRRLHAISLFVMRASGLPWPAQPVVRMGRVHATVVSRQGFHVVLFRDGDLGYALVSDVDSGELLRLGEKIVGR